MENSNRIQPEGFYLLRTPLLPVNRLLEFYEVCREQDPVMLVKDIFLQPLLEEALYIASPALHGEFKNFVAQTSKDEKKANKMVKSLVKYLSRMATRPTPYGLFAGCNTGQCGSSTIMKLNNRQTFRKERRLDMYYVSELVTAITAIPAIRNRLRYFVNNSLYQTGDKLRYTEFQSRNKKRMYHLSAVDNSPYLQNILCQAAKGATLQELRKALLAFDTELDEEETAAFVDSLVDNQLLVSELEPTITGEIFFTALIKQLQSIPEAANIVPVLMQVQDLLQQQQPGIDSYLAIEKLIQSIMPGTTSKDLVQVDLFVNCHTNTIDTAWMNALTEQVAQLFRLTDTYSIEDIETFKKEFYTRYEDQEVPLMEALDPEFGIGYGSYTPGTTDHNPLVDPFNIQRREQELTVKWNKLMQYKLEKYSRALSTNAKEIVIEDKDIDYLSKGKMIRLPEQFYAIGSLTKRNDRNDMDLVLSNMAGPSVGEVMGRFCHGDNVLHRAIRNSYDREQEKYPGILFPEVVHLPQQRVGNILLRPVLRDYEIPFLAQPGVDEEHQLPVTDLMVSIVNNEIVLRSKKWNKRVLPKLTSAHNYSIGNLSVYKFLCDIHFQQLNMVFSWNWDVLGGEAFLPRVRYRNIILKKAQWSIKLNDYPFLEGNSPLKEKISFLRDQLKARQVPAYVTQQEADNLLLIDTASDLSLEILMDLLLKKKNLVIAEFMQLPGQCVVNGEDGQYTQEVILPFSNEGLVYHDLQETMERRQLFSPHHIQRKIQLGQEWIYFRIFCGTRSGERLLKEQIIHLVNNLKQQQMIEKWFFIRYFDPAPHIRLRFFNSQQPSFWGTVIQQVEEALASSLEDGWITHMETDTYIRELERYQPAFMEHSETFFYHDSEAVLQVLSLLDDRENSEQFRWLLALRSIDSLLDDFGLSLAEKFDLMDAIANNFFSEFGKSRRLQHLLNDQYRTHYPLIRNFMDPGQDSKNEIEAAIRFFQQRAAANIALVEKIRLGIPESSFSVMVYELLPSYIHMFCNRMFISAQRKNELVLYHYLRKFYESKLARESLARKKQSLEAINTIIANPAVTYDNGE